MKVDGEAANPSGLTGEFELGVALGQSEFCPLALGDVDVDAYHPLGAPIFTVRNRTASLDPSDLAGWDGDAVLCFVLLPPVGKSLVTRPFRPPKILRVYSRLPFTIRRFGRPLG